jgi:hypothetical protein
MSHWIADRQPTAEDADLHGMVRWGPLRPGLLMPWIDVRPGEQWAHTTAWQPPAEAPEHG